MAAVSAFFALTVAIAQAEGRTAALATPVNAATPTPSVEAIKQALLGAKWNVTIYVQRNGRQKASFIEENGQLKVIVTWLGSKDVMDVSIDTDGTVRYSYETGYDFVLRYDWDKGTLAGTSTRRSTGEKAEVRYEKAT